MLALIAARAGARKVYAIEANAEAVRRAREAVSRATDVPPGVIEVLEGFSTAVTLPEKADLLVAEIVGSIMDFVLVVDDPPGAVKRLADPAVKILSLTITEKGYCLGCPPRPASAPLRRAA